MYPVRPTKPRAAEMTDDTDEPFCLIRWNGEGTSVPISKDDTYRIFAARRCLAEITSLEEKFVAIIEGFKALETCVFRSAMDIMLYADGSSPTAWEEAHSEFGRYVLSFLSMVRLYQDTLVTHAREVSRGEIPDDEVAQLLRDAYDTSFSYRVMEAVRNYTQHRSFPVHTSEYIMTAKDNRRHYGVEFQFRAEDVKESKRFKRLVLEEIERDDGQVDLAWCIRNYFGKICDVHRELRDKLTSYKEDAERTLGHFQALWVGMSESELTRVVACKQGQHRQASPLMSIDPRVDAYRVKLENRTRLISEMGDRRVDVYVFDPPEDWLNQKYKSPKQKLQPKAR